MGIFQIQVNIINIKKRGIFIFSIISLFKRIDINTLAWLKKQDSSIIKKASKKK